MTAADMPIRDAATIILLRRMPEGLAVLMGMRGAKAAFMPSKYVFPGGAVDQDDALTTEDGADPDCLRRLSLEPRAGTDMPAPAILAAALRELTEETGLHLRDGAAALRFVFRAITPPGRPRRFDARFFAADAAQITGDPDDFSAACDELSHLHWVPVAQARALNLPFITEVVLAEVEALARGHDHLPRPETVPFFDNRSHAPRFVQIR
ncbi:MAG: NUDIX hydrolase [Paracoccus sp. (in: a-proteobacteria)]|uniref:NUDIX hydrolase n=1 Tax=Paracoccus sp. TaxID=267 RepID=UPI0026DF2E03|nr:NUDIX hydrolase [Paracoccus sp. (in: a-proteobacteria)]MDO5622066.1 NUDIX hydrolase [Paracoccus sp. (in: a-proteobacteria)]